MGDEVKGSCRSRKDFKSLKQASKYVDGISDKQGKGKMMQGKKKKVEITAGYEVFYVCRVLPDLRH